MLLELCFVVCIFLNIQDQTNAAPSREKQYLVSVSDDLVTNSDKGSDKLHKDPDAEVSTQTPYYNQASVVSITEAVHGNDKHHDDEVTVTEAAPALWLKKKKRSPVEAIHDNGAVSKTHGKKVLSDTVSGELEEEYEDFEVITDEDRQKAHQAMMDELTTFAGYTLVAVACSLFVIICFLMDPRICLIAFSSGSPCCLLCPCYRSLMKYTDPAKLIKANINLYVPGIYIEKGGKMREYPPTTEEMDALMELIGEFHTVT